MRPRLRTLAAVVAPRVSRAAARRLHGGGVRTKLLWFFESRGHQQIYDPGGVYFFLPVINAWNTLPIAQQNLLMNGNPGEGDRPVPDDVTFKTKDGNNVYIA